MYNTTYRYSIFYGTVRMYEVKEIEERKSRSRNMHGLSGRNRADRYTGPTAPSPRTTVRTDGGTTAGTAGVRDDIATMHMPMVSC